eukprot:2357942-Alexandrium_andersonii.AAC.1
MLGRCLLAVVLVERLYEENKLLGGRFVIPERCLQEPTLAEQQGGIQAHARREVTPCVRDGDAGPRREGIWDF